MKKALENPGLWCSNTVMENKKPNVFVVLSTQWRASAFGFAGDPNASTPNLDALAGEGLCLRQAVTPHPFGVFARAAFLTACRSPRNGVEDYYDSLPADRRTLAHAFKENGYTTAFFGKWQLFERDPRAPVVGEAHARVVVPPGRRGGFDFWEGFESGFLLNDPLLHGTELPEPTRFAGYQSSVLVERLASYLGSRQGAVAPRFVVLSLDAPHPPYAAPAAGGQRLHEASIRLQSGTTRDPEARERARRELAGYYAHVQATDAALGRLIRHIRDLGLWENSLFAFTSVHGDMHGLDGKFRKGWPDEGAVRIPMLLAGGAWDLPSGSSSEVLASLTDLGPTLLGMAGCKARQAFEHGLDLTAALKGEEPGPAMQELSMPSVPPFPQQCPYGWTACRDTLRTQVFPRSSGPFEIRHDETISFEE